MSSVKSTNPNKIFQLHLAQATTIRVNTSNNNDEINIQNQTSSNSFGSSRSLDGDASSRSTSMSSSPLNKNHATKSNQKFFDLDNLGKFIVTHHPQA